LGSLREQAFELTTKSPMFRAETPHSGTAKPELITQFGLHTRFFHCGTNNFEYSKQWQTAIWSGSLREQAFELTTKSPVLRAKTPHSGAAKPELITQFGLHTRFVHGGTNNFEYSKQWQTAI
jgi:hypothetical protein